MRSMMTGRRMLASVMAVMLLAAGLARAQVMEQVPSDAFVVLKIKNLGAASAKLGKFLQDLGLAAMQPGLEDPLTFLQTKANIKQGLNKDGDFAIVFRDPDASGESPDKSMVVLIPVSDYSAFVGNFAGAKTEGDVTEATLPMNNEPAYFAHWGNFAAMSPSKAIVAAKPSSTLTVSGLATNKELNDKDVVLYANLVGLRAKFLPKLQENKEKWLTELDQNVSKEEKVAKFAPVIKAIAGQAIQGAEAFLRDGQAASVSLNFGADGINTSVMAEFAPNSYIGNIFASLKNTDEVLLKGLPTGKYLLLGGGVSDPAVGAKILDDITAPIVKELTALGPEYKPATDYVDALKQFVAANKGSAFGMVAPTGALGQEAIVQFVTIANGDSAAMKAAQQKLVKSQEEAMKSFGLPGTEAYKATWTSAAKTLDGVTFDSMSANMNANANDPAAQQQAQMLQLMYGPGGMNMLLGDMGGNLLIVSGLSDPFISSAIAAVKAGEAPLAGNAGVKAVAANLPKSRLAEIYVPVDEIVTTGLSYARQFGAPINLQLPADLPPIGCTASTDGTAIRFDGYVPSSLVQSLVAAGMQVMMQMQGGGQPGGPGGL